MVRLNHIAIFGVILCVAAIAGSLFLEIDLRALMFFAFFLFAAAAVKLYFEHRDEREAKSQRSAPPYVQPEAEEDESGRETICATCSTKYCSTKYARPGFCSKLSCANFAGEPLEDYAPFNLRQR